MSEPILTFFVAGIPKPAGSKRAWALKKGGIYTGRVIVTDQSGKAGSDWRSDVRAVACEAYQGAPFNCALCVDFEFYFPRPQSHYRISKTDVSQLRADAPKWHTTTPDRTKVTRGIEDALTGILWADDSRIVDGRTTKRYCNDGERPGVRITMRLPDA